MFLDHFRLREQPFGVTPDPRYLFPSPGHREGLASLIYGIESNLGFGALIAQPGMGKTTLLFHVLERYRHTARTAFIFNTQCSSYELLRSLLNELDDKTDFRETLQMHERFKQILAAEANLRRRVILVIDEAQNLTNGAMETVRLLSNFESADCKLLHIVLAGQPELAARLAQPDLSQLQQRIPILSCLQNLLPSEVASYIEHRLRVAGYQGRPLFTPEAIGHIAAYSRGVPREINRLCFNCLSIAYASSKSAVDVPVVQEVAADLDLSSRLQPRTVAARSAEASTTQAAARTEQPQAPPHPVSRPIGVTREAAMPVGQSGRVAVQGPARPVASTPQSRPATLRPQMPQRPVSGAMQQRPRATAPSSRRSSAYGWPTRWRPLAYALFYLTLIGGGLVAMKWNYPAAQTVDQTLSSTNAAGEAEPAGRSVAEAKHVPANRFNKTALPATKSKSRTRNSTRKPEPSRAQDTQPANRNPFVEQPREGPTVIEPSLSSGAQPELMKFVPPRYPEEAQNRHIEGTVVLSAVVGSDGTIKSIRPVSGNPVLMRAAESAVRSWIYRPLQNANGQPDIDKKIVINFSLPEERSSGSREPGHDRRSPQ